MKYIILKRSTCYKKPYNILIICILIIFLQSCTALKPYQKIYVNDPEMQMGVTSDKAFENYVETIREGSVIPGSKKTGGGCGCN